MPLKLGVWSCNLNGVTGELHLTGLDATGQVTGMLNVLGPLKGAIIGLWDETSREFSFIIKDLVSDLESPYFEAVVFSTPKGAEPGRDVVWSMLGFFHVIDQTLLSVHGGNSRRNTFGWAANITEVA
jgi:hypothetical protein